MPTIGPVHERSAKRGIIDTTLTISTNCVEVGESLVIQGTVINEAPYPLRFVGTPTFDFIIRPADWNPADGPEPVRHWSQTATYPTIDPVLAPGETRTYEWQWPVEAVYAKPGLRGMSGVRIQFWRGDVQPEGIPAGGQIAGVGEGGLPAPEITCACVR
jgi:hypothetical protein